MAECSNGTKVGLGGCFGHCPKCKCRFSGSLCWGPSCHCLEMAPLSVDKLILLLEHDINPEDAAKTLLGLPSLWIRHDKDDKVIGKMVDLMPNPHEET